MMGIDDIEERLSSFAERAKCRERECDQIRVAYGRIMVLRESGHTVKAIWEDLRDGGLRMTYAGFKSVLRRTALKTKERQSMSFADTFDFNLTSKEHRHRWK
ncbi:hypothetical protein EGJ54_25055 [Pandoraea apista]|nr:hypothetical protein EGJ54_25055 [Pandoraea apista]RRW96721.1 hypothetical protein EGJ56_24995 [Pandoraea apista]